MRILHVVDPAFPGGGGCTLRQLSGPLARIRSAEQRTVVLGTRAHAALATRCDVPVDGVVPVPAGRPLFAARALRRLIHTWERTDGPFDIFQGWSLGAAVALGAAAPGRRMVAWASVGPVSEPGLSLLRRATRRNPVPILAGDPRVLAAFARAGFDRSHLSVLPAAVDPDAIDPGRRNAIRGRWGTSRRETTVGLLGEPIRWGDARRAVDVGMRAAVAGRPVRIVAHPDAARRDDAERWCHALDHENMMILDDDAAEPWRIAPGFDVVLAIEPPPSSTGYASAAGAGRGGALGDGGVDTSEVALVGRLGAGGPERIFGLRGLLLGGDRAERPDGGIAPVLWAMAAGKPVVATPSIAAAAGIVHERTGLIVPEDDPGAASLAVERLHDHPELGASLGAAARAFIASERHVSGFCVRMREAWERLANDDSVHVPEEPRTASEAARSVAAEVHATHDAPGAASGDAELRWFDRSAGTWVDAGAEEQRDDHAPGERRAD